MPFWLVQGGPFRVQRLDGLHCRGGWAPVLRARFKAINLPSLDKAQSACQIWQVYSAMFSNVRLCAVQHV